MNKKIFHSVHAFAKKLGKAAIFVAFVGIAFFAGAHNGNLSGIPQAHADTNIQLSDTFTGAKFVTGATSSFSIFVANTSTVSSMNVNASDTLPTGLTFVSATSSISGMTFSTTTNATGTQVVSWGSFNIDPQSTTTITLTVAVTGSPACGLQNTVNVDEFVNENNGSSHSHSQVNEGPACTVLPAANLSIAKTVNGTSTIVSGNPVTYTITVKALGPATSTGVTATDAWSSTGLTYVTSTPSLGTYASSTGLWKINDMASGTVATLNITGMTPSVTATTTITNWATVCESASSTNTNASTTASSTITVTPTIADLSMGKTADATTSTVNVARTVNYLLTVKAFGPATSTDVVATDTLPAGVTYVTSTPSEGTTTFSAGTLTWNIPDMVPGTIATTSVQTTVDATSTGPLTNWATVTESPLLTNTSTSTASSTITVENPATCVGGSCYDISVTKIASDPNPTGNEAITYTITVSNSGSTDADLVHVTDALPNVLTLSATQSVTDSQGTVTNGGTLDWAVGSLVPGASATLKIPVVVNALADGTNVLNVAKTYTELLGSNVILSAATSTIAVQAAPVTPVTPSCTGNCGGGGGGGGGTATGGGGGSAYEISIDGGAATTATTSAMLSLYGTDAYQMELSNSTNFGSSTWQLYATTLPWTLTSGGGEKTVYVKYRDISKNYLGSAQDSIDLVQGQVLGASTSSCGMYLDKYIKLDADNDSFEVKKLQVFLNYDLGLNLPVTGTYDTTTYNAVEQFQLKYNIGVLSPWVPYGLVSDTTPTGYVYKTTRRMINLIMCPSLDLPMPPLSKEG